MNNHDFQFMFVSDTSLRLIFSETTTKAQVYQLSQQLIELAPHAIVNVIPAYHSILIEYLPNRLEERFLVELLLHSIPNLLESSSISMKSKQVDIPVYYAPETALDLESYHAQGISLEQIIEVHTSTQFEVAAIGFAPGFAFLEGLPARLQLPRKATPRTHVPKGSVAIAGSKTAIYPDDSPGGWNIIGRTPLTLFSPSKPSLAYKISDIVTFRAISRSDFLALGGEL